MAIWHGDPQYFWQRWGSSMIMNSKEQAIFEQFGEDGLSLTQRPCSATDGTTDLLYQKAVQQADRARRAAINRQNDGVDATQGFITTDNTAHAIGTCIDNTAGQIRWPINPPPPLQPFTPQEPCKGHMPLIRDIINGATDEEKEMVVKEAKDWILVDEENGVTLSFDSEKEAKEAAGKRIKQEKCVECHIYQRTATAGSKKVEVEWT